MRISYEWLKDYLRGGEVPSAEEAARLLTLSGLEVEAVERPEAHLFQVVVGEVRESAPHPNADRLSVCRVFDGTGEHTVVCGAPNVRAGMRSAFAPVGTALPGGLTIAAREVRGVPSEGMLCAEDELGLGEGHEGILDLGAKAEVGTPLAEALGLDDVIFEIGVTPNRPDALSHLGTARDLAALAGLKLKAPAARFKAAGEATAEAASVRIEDPDRCPRYVARVVEGVKVRPSPAWLVARLRAAGVRAINNVVDATNYVLMELGHPLHAFDLDRLGGHAIVVRRAKAGERMRTLDDVERTLDPDDLVIADAEVPVALAGVMGGGDSEVHAGTTRLLVESAYFEPTGVRRTARRHGLHTEASHRFERGADPEMARFAADRCAALIARLSGGEVRPDALDVYPKPAPAREVKLRWKRTSEVLGYEVPAKVQRDVLKRLGFVEADKARDGATWRVPSFRTEMEREVDLIEEVARIHGYDRIPVTLPSRAPDLEEAPSVTGEGVLIPRLRAVAAAAGCHEVVNYSFLSEAEVLAVARDPDAAEARPIALANPLSAEQAVMRTTVLSSLLANLRVNRRHREQDLKLYEIGRAYLMDGEVSREPLRLAAVLSGRRAEKSWATADAPVDFYDAKGLVEAALSALNVTEARFTPAGREIPWLHPRSAARVAVGGEACGWLGEVHPRVAEAFELGAGVFAVELDVDVLARHAALRPDYRGVPRFPAVLRDLAVVLGREVPADRVLGLLSEPLPEAEALGAEVADATLFDVYEGPQVGEGKKSLAFAIRYQAPDRTLTDDEATKLHEALLRRLEAEVGAELRA